MITILSILIVSIFLGRFCLWMAADENTREGVAATCAVMVGVCFIVGLAALQMLVIKLAIML